MKNTTNRPNREDTTLEKKMKYYKKEWLKVHRWLLVIMGVGLVGWLTVGILLKNSIMIAVTPFLVLLSHGWRNNTMMAYVEYKVFGDGKK